MVFEICKKTKTNIYLSGKGALNYLTKENLQLFKKNNMILNGGVYSSSLFTISELSFVDGYPV
jgi:hypothetical protein